ncbi:MAG: hypothetical protein HUU21_38290 [Polyangiaceae bacterium]|nr:hypothetical protein [Polyangiaceae bacterium]
MRPPASLLGLSPFLLLLGCTPELGDAPFACSSDGACPEGYACRSAVCVLEGNTPQTARPKRVTWINSGEMFWLEAPSGGASLLVNDGFSPGAHGIFEIHAAPDGTISEPRELLAYGDQFPMASSVVALSDGRYGVITLSFPAIDGDKLTLKVLAVERNAPKGSAPAVETLYTNDEEPFLGGTEPAYVSAVAGDGTIDLAWTRPDAGGRVEVLRLSKDGALWKPGTPLRKALPPNVLPLSGDCALFPVAKDKLVLRVGFEEFALAEVDVAAGTFGEFAGHAGLPIFAWDGKALVLRFGDENEATASLSVSYALTDLAGIKDDAVDQGGALQDGTDVYTALPYEGGALFAPLSSDPAFPELGIGWRSPTEPLRQVATVKRQSADRIYSARALAAQGKVYVAWTEFHESLMDLWVAVVPLSMPRMSAGMSASAGDGAAEVSAPRRVARLPMDLARAWRKP